MESTHSKLTTVPPDVQFAEVLFQWRNQEKIKKFTPIQNSSLEQIEMRIKAAGNDLSQKIHSEYMWFVLLDGKPIGTVSLFNADWNMKYAELGIHFDEKFHGKGFAAASVQMVINQIFNKSDLEKIYALCSVWNNSSWKLLEKLRFSRDGMLRKHFIIQGVRVDQFHYSILKEEWDSNA